MNELVFKGQNDQVVTTSLKVAEVFQKEHRRVLQDIRDLACSDVFRLHNFVQSSYTNTQNKEMPMFIITRDGFTLLAMGYNGEKAMKFKEDYINAFNEMERTLKSQFQVPTTFAEALRLAADQQEQIEQQAKKLEAQKPKADYYDGLVERGNNLNFRDTAKLLGIGEKAFIFMLIDKKYIYRDAKGKLKPIAQYVGKYFKLKEWTTNDKSGTQTLITVKGRERFAELIKELKEGKE